MLVFFGCGLAGPSRSDAPPPEMLDAIFPVLRGKKMPSEPLEIRFDRKPEVPVDPTCDLKAIDLVESRGAEVHTFRLLGEPVSDSDDQPAAMLIRLKRMTVNADGSRRAYHPNDPFGLGICQKPIKGSATQACALDYLSNAEIQVYQGDRRVPQFHAGGPGHTREPNPAFATTWGSLWSEIAARKNNWVDLGALFGNNAPEETRLYYSKETNSAVTFDTAIIPFKDGYPCQHSGGDLREYFVAATKPHPAPPPGPKDDECRTAHYLDSMQIPFFVLPGGVFKHMTIGDVAVGLAVTGKTERLVFGVVGDAGPRDQIGEGSIQFVRKLRGSLEEPKNSDDTGKLDIAVATEPDAINALSVLVIGGTAKALGVDYSRQNIEKIGRTALTKWLANKPKRLQACTNAAAPNPLDGFEGVPPN